LRDCQDAKSLNLFTVLPATNLPKEVREKAVLTSKARRYNA